MCRLARALRAARADDACSGRENAVRRVARLARSLCGGERRIAAEIELSTDGDVDQLTIVVTARLMQEREVDVGFERILRRVQHRHDVQAWYLGLGVHLRGARAVV